MNPTRYIETKIPEGRRNQTLFVVALKALSWGLDIEPIRVKAITVDGLPESEVDRTIESAKRYVKTEVIENDPVAFLDRLFLPIDTICFVKRVGKRFEDIFLTYDEAIEFLNNYEHEDGVEWFFRINSIYGGNRDEHVDRFAHTLVESDSEPIERQFELLERLKDIVSEAHFSGSKSLHILVHVNASSHEDYKLKVAELHRKIKAWGFNVDAATKNPSRLSRLPYTRREENEVSVVYLGNPKPFEDFMILNGLPERIRRAGLPKSIASTTTATPPPVLIDGLMRVGHKAMVSGSAKIGKSMSMLHLAAALSTGGEWFGMRCTKSSVLYVNVEIDDYTVKRRVEDMMNAGIDCEDVHLWNLRGNYDRGSDILRALENVLKYKKYDVVIFDPVYMIMDGDESNAEHVKSFLTRIDQIIVGCGISAILVHHFAKGLAGQKTVIDRASGSTNFARWADAFVTLSPLQTQIRNAFRLDVISRSLKSPDSSEWVLNYPLFQRINGAGLRVVGESPHE